MRYGALKPDVKKLYIEVTTRCNFDCITCIRSSWNDELSHMAPETFKKIINDLGNLLDLECVHFGGFGEPFSHPGIIGMLRSVKETGVKVEIITNGSLLTGDVIDCLIDLKIDMVYDTPIKQIKAPDQKVWHIAPYYPFQ